MHNISFVVLKVIYKSQKIYNWIKDVVGIWGSFLGKINLAMVVFGSFPLGAIYLISSTM